MATSEIEICNFALDDIGSSPIESFDDKNSKAAKLCKRWYSVSRRSLLKDICASFAITREVLAESDKKIAYGYYNCYKLPHDCLRLLNVNARTDIQKYPIENNYILCDIPEKLFIRYVFDNKNVADYDDEFVKLLALEIAININLPLTEDLEKQSYLENKFKQKYVETSGKYAADNKIIIVNRPRFRAAKIFDNHYYGNIN